MQRPTTNDFDHASLEAMMERYRDELLRYQRATPPGKPTLAQNLEASERGRSTRAATTGKQPSVQSRTEAQTRAPQYRPPTQPVFENQKSAVQSEVRREKIPVDTPPIMLLPRLSSRLETAIQDEQETTAPNEQPTVILPQLPEAPPVAPVPPVQPVQTPRPVDMTSGIGTMNTEPEEADSTEQQFQPSAVQTESSLQPAPDVVLEPTQVPPQQSAPESVAAPMPLSAEPIQPIAAPMPLSAEPIQPIAAPMPLSAEPMQPIAVPMPLSEPIAVPMPLSAEPMQPIAVPMPSSAAPMPPSAAPMPPSVAPMLLTAVPPVETASSVQPTPAFAPAKNNRAVAPVPAEQPGCIAHTEFEKATGAYGVFRPYERMGKYTLASFLQTPGEAIQTLVRFAADVPTGSADAIRCRRSFTVKFFCREGEYDLFGMHLPVSVGTTEKTLTDCCAVSRPSSKTGLRTRAAFWEFLVTHPEALHAAMWLYSDLGTIGSYRTIDGYGLPCLWVNAKNEHRAVRPRWLSRQRPQTLTRFEAEELAGSDPDAVARDLVSSLQAGDRPQYELSIQIIEPSDFAELPFDPFDPTAIWPAEQFKPQRIGLLTLERPPDDAQVELDCERFKPENIIPGIEHVPAPSKSGDDFTQVQQYLRSLGEFSRHRLIDNLSEELLRLPPLLLEQVLILFSRADLEFGQAVTLALGG